MIIIRSLSVKDKEKYTKKYINFVRSHGDLERGFEDLRLYLFMKEKVPLGRAKNIIEQLKLYFKERNNNYGNK